MTECSSSFWFSVKRLFRGGGGNRGSICKEGYVCRRALSSLTVRAYTMERLQGQGMSEKCKRT